MKAVMLAAGSSTRTAPLTVTRPKPLLCVAGKSILEHNLSQLQGLVDEVIIIVGYQKAMIGDSITALSLGNMNVRCVEQQQPKGSGDALLAAKQMLNDRFLVLNGDDLYAKRDLQRLLKVQGAAMLVQEVEHAERFGVVVEEHGKVKQLLEKPSSPTSKLINTGAYVLDRAVLSLALKKSPRGEYELVDFLQPLIKQQQLSAVHGKDWHPIGYPWNLLIANEASLLNLKKSIKGAVEPYAVLKGVVVIGKGTVIKSGSYIEGPVIIGEHCTIGPNCFIRASTSIGNYCKVGNACEVKNSIVMDHTSIGHLSYVGDSVLGEHVNLGAGTITANLRHDDATVKSMVKGELVDSYRRKLGAIIGDHAHTGIHTSIYPGRKIWPKQTTVPGEVVKEDKL
ncbi:NTP transferase domain-containing protein [Candidatus Woesearchaeota archaeon]|nr:NTP transferase domain-containing protein [Candidatus Woesearchaeota archaeon]